LGKKPLKNEAVKPVSPGSIMETW